MGVCIAVGRACESMLRFRGSMCAYAVQWIEHVGVCVAVDRLCECLLSCGAMFWVYAVM